MHTPNPNIHTNYEINNVSACYDRIIANDLSFNTQREGKLKKKCKLRVNILNKSNHYVQISLGLSSKLYSNI